ncbi:hypothetical protein [Thioalkalivibrio sp. ALJ1]|uniref:hypothetical protein n=1 Tax=Thioalkalivibrio sp. ALJ1 TaxID=1158144 RepID=UPI0012DFF43A|nr:hypothetical protein [Thioalkalivibrio sp. ALJ1]
MDNLSKYARDFMSRQTFSEDEIREYVRREEMGPYERAQWELDNDRDEELWVRCMVKARQDVDEARSLYIDQAAGALIREVEEEEVQQRVETEERARLWNRDRREALGKIPWLSRRNGAVVGGAPGRIPSSLYL